MSAAAVSLLAHRKQFDDCCYFGLIASARRQRNVMRSIAAKLIAAGL